MFASKYFQFIFTVFPCGEIRSFTLKVGDPNKLCYMISSVPSD